MTKIQVNKMDVTWEDMNTMSMAVDWENKAVFWKAPDKNYGDKEMWHMKLATGSYSCHEKLSHAVANANRILYLRETKQL